MLALQEQINEEESMITEQEQALLNEYRSILDDDEALHARREAFHDKLTELMRSSGEAKVKGHGKLLEALTEMGVYSGLTLGKATDSGPHGGQHSLVGVDAVSPVPTETQPQPQGTVASQPQEQEPPPSAGP